MLCLLNGCGLSLCKGPTHFWADRPDAGEGADAAELGIGCPPAYWGIGITTEAARAVVAFGSESLNLPVITSATSRTILLRDGCFASSASWKTGRVMRPCLAAGGEVPSLRMELGRTSRRGRYGKAADAAFPIGKFQREQHWEAQHSRCLLMQPFSQNLFPIHFPRTACRTWRNGTVASSSNGWFRDAAPNARFANNGSFCTSG